jgi:hypothetical protein
VKREDLEHLREAFDRQVENLIRKGYPQAAGLSAEEFLQHIEPLKERVRELNTAVMNAKPGRIPFVIVVKSDLVAAEATMPMVEVNGAKGSVGMHPVEPQSFRPIEGLPIPGGMAYLLVDIDTGRESLNVRPHDARNELRQANRSPLTIDEGVALVTHFPEVLVDKQSYNCFWMLGSRRGDQRVPALWISFKRPRLGWCWDNNPHTWLGSASCGGRL